jgi:hypothetical protein
LTASRAPWLLAATAAALFLGAQSLTVYGNYRGNWTGLFCTGSAVRLPPELEPFSYRSSSDGYDGQYYRIVAYDPFFVRGFHAFVDSPALRYRRILVPLLAYVLAAGQPFLLDASYVLVIAAFAAAGVFWSARWAASHGSHPAWGLGFLLLPAAVTSADRLTIDVATAALTVAAIHYAAAERFAPMWAALAAAVLSRETALVLVAAACLYYLWVRRWKLAVLAATSAVPALLWYAFAHRKLTAAGSGSPGVPAWIGVRPQLGIGRALFDPPDYPFTPAAALLAQSLDTLALAGMAVALLMAAYLLAVRRRELPALFAACHLPLFLVVNRFYFWETVYGYGRLFTPLLIGLLLCGGKRWRTAAAMPVLFIDARLAFEISPQILGLFR